MMFFLPLRLWLLKTSWEEFNLLTHISKSWNGSYRKCQKWNLWTFQSEIPYFENVAVKCVNIAKFTFSLRQSYFAKFDLCMCLVFLRQNFWLIYCPLMCSLSFREKVCQVFLSFFPLCRIYNFFWSHLFSELGSTGNCRLYLCIYNLPIVLQLKLNWSISK